MVIPMKIELTPEQSKQIIEDEVLEIKDSNGFEIYIEFKNKRLDYCELDLGLDEDRGNKRNTVCFDRDDLQKIVPREPHYGYSNSPQCPKCGTYLIYEFKNCPECGQTIKWGKR